MTPIDLVEQIISVQVDVSKDKDAGDWLMWGKKLFTFGQSAVAAKPVCSMGLKCRSAYQTKHDNRSEKDKQHLREHRHLCLHGQTCKDRAEPAHEQYWMHLTKEDCCDGDLCRNLGNVHHRAQYHHQGKWWDFLLPCRDGSRCIIKIPKHFQQYYHEAIEFVITEDEVLCQPIDDSFSDTSMVSSRAHQGGMAVGSAAAAAAAPPSTATAESQHSPQPATPRRLDFSDIRASVQEDMDDVGDIYNDDAIAGMYGDAKLDKYGYPMGDFDLAKDGSLVGYKVLIGLFQDSLQTDVNQLTIPELKKKGLQVLVCKCMDTFTATLKAEKVHVAWIISAGSLGNGNTQNFLEEVVRFHKAGRFQLIQIPNMRS